MMAVRPSSCASVLRRHVVLADVDAVGARGQRHVDTVVDQQRDLRRRQHAAQGARLLHHGAGGGMLVAQLHQRRAVDDAAGQIGERAAAGDRRIDQGVKAQIDVHHVTRAWRRRAGSSSR